MQWVNTNTPTKFDGIPHAPGHIARTIDEQHEVAVDTTLVVLNRCHACGSITPIGVPARGDETADEWWETLARVGMHASEQADRHLDECGAATRRSLRVA
jgi:hypothetical protein